jgi:hypothetical protein
MPKECAFCSSPATSKEHIWSNWMGPLFPGDKHFQNSAADFQKGLEISSNNTWNSPKLNWKAKVVCGNCNNGWMSDLENNLAKPAMKDLISGKWLDFPINQLRANQIASFAFKTSVILDHLADGRPRFFSSAARRVFRSSLRIPDNIMMWFAGYLPSGGGGVFSNYYALAAPHKIELYVCSFRAGHFAFQVVAFNMPRSIAAVPTQTAFNDLAVPFWPKIIQDFTWPPATVLYTLKEFEEFANRWGVLNIRRFT